MNFRTVLPAALMYLGLVYIAGFVFGVIRVLWIAPVMGDDIAEVSETPLMVLIAFLAAGFVVKRYRVRNLSVAIAQGLLALLLLLVIEFSLVEVIRGVPLADYFASRRSLAGLAYAAGLTAFAAMPGLLVACKR